MNRKEIVLNIIKKNPGIRFNEIMRISNIRNGTLSHYVKKLEDEESIELERSPRVTRLYPTGIPSDEAKICNRISIGTAIAPVVCNRNILLIPLRKGR